MGWADQIAHARHQNPDLAVAADSAYGAHADWAARPKPKNEPRPAEDVHFNRAIASFRAPVERTIALLKQWRILSNGYRGRLTDLPTVIHVIVNLEFYQQAGDPCSEPLALLRVTDLQATHKFLATVPTYIGYRR